MKKIAPTLQPGRFDNHPVCTLMVYPEQTLEDVPTLNQSVVQ